MLAFGMQTELIDNYEQDRMIKALKELHRDALKSRTMNGDGGAKIKVVDCVLRRNIEWLSDQVALTDDEKQILLFSVLIRQNLFLGLAVDALGSMSKSRAMSVLSVLLDIPLSRMRLALSEDASLVQSGMLNIDGHLNYDLSSKVEMLTGLADQPMIEQKNLYYLFRQILLWRLSQN
jgi:hypothetical protein